MQRNVSVAFRTVMVTGYLLLVFGVIVLLMDPRNWKLALMEIASGLLCLRIVYQSGLFRVSRKNPFNKNQ